MPPPPLLFVRSGEGEDSAAGVGEKIAELAAAPGELTDWRRSQCCCDETRGATGGEGGTAAVAEEAAFECDGARDNESAPDLGRDRSIDCGENKGPGDSASSSGCIGGGGGGGGESGSSAGGGGGGIAATVFEACGGGGGGGGALDGGGGEGDGDGATLFDSPAFEADVTGCGEAPVAAICAAVDEAAEEGVGADACRSIRSRSAKG